MTVAEWAKHEMDIGTVSLRDAAPRLEIDDESAIPSQFWKRADPSLDRAGLLKALKDYEKGERANNGIPGCHLEAGGKSLTIRRS